MAIGRRFSDYGFREEKENKFYDDQSNKYIGLNRMLASIPNSHKMPKLVASYKEKYLKLQSSKTTHEFFHYLEELFILLAKMQKRGSHRGKDFSLDILQELKELYFWLVNNRPRDLQSFYLENIEVKDKENTKKLPKEFLIMKSLFNMVNNGYTPYLMQNVVTFVYALTKYKQKRKKEYHLIVDENIIKKQINQLVDAVKSEKLQRKFTILESLIDKGSIKTYSESAFSNYGSAGLFNSKERKNSQRDLLSKDNNEIHHQRFCACEGVIQQIIAILNDPEFIGLDKKIQKKLTSKLRLAIIYYFSTMEGLYSESKLLQEKLEQDKRCYSMVQTISSKIVKNFGSMEQLAKKINFDSSKNKDATRQELETCLNKDETSTEEEQKQFLIKNLEGGNSLVLLITDQSTSIIFRNTEILTGELDTNDSPEQLRLQITNSLSLAPTSTQVYMLYPSLSKNDMVDPASGETIICLEMSEVVPEGNFLQHMKQCGQAYETDPSEVNLQRLQLSFLDHVIQAGELLLHLHDKDRFYSDMKATNLLLTKDGMLKVSDCKSIKPFSRSTGTALQVTPLFFQDDLVITKKDETEEERMERFLLGEKFTFVSTLWQMAINNIDLPHDIDENRCYTTSNFITAFGKFLEEASSDKNTNPLFSGELGKCILDVLKLAKQLISENMSLKQFLDEFNKLKPDVKNQPSKILTMAEEPKRSIFGH